jgi:serine/threonine-protein kinase
MNAQKPSHVPFEAGAVVGGKYRIISLIGVGGVGRVFLARHIELDTDVAIKVLRPEMSDRPDAVQRFAREARASVKLRSERIARVLDVGTHEGKPYFVMEYMAGSSLLEVSQQANVDIATLCEFFIQACEGLADAHAQGVVHRDIKPENLFVVRDPSGWRSLKVFDFGISKFSLTGKYSDVDLAAMRTEAMMGTPHYISPEQIRSSRDVDHRTDIWSLGAVMFEVLSGGKLPFREEREVTALIAEVLEQPHRSLLDIAPNVPERLVAIVDRCLAKDRELRYQTAAEVALELLPLAPARARASAERAVSVMQAAGMMPINGDMESLRPVNVALAERPPSIPPPSIPPPSVPAVSVPAPGSVPPSDDATQSPLSGLRPSESMRALAAQVAAAAAVSSSARRAPVGSARPPMPSPSATFNAPANPTPTSGSGPLVAEAADVAQPLPARPITPAVALALTVSSAPQPAVSVSEAEAFETVAYPHRKRRLAWVLLLLLACSLLGLVLWLMQSPSPQVAVVAAPPLASIAPKEEPQVLVSPAAPAQPPSAASAASAEKKPAPPKPVWVSRPTWPAAPAPVAAKPGFAAAPDSPSVSPSSPLPSSPPVKLDLRRER